MNSATRLLLLLGVVVVAVAAGDGADNAHMGRKAAVDGATAGLSGARRGRSLLWCLVDCEGCSGGKKPCAPGYTCIDNWWPKKDECKVIAGTCVATGCSTGYECNPSSSLSCTPVGCVATGCDNGYECDKSSGRCEAQGCLASGCESGYECDTYSTQCKPKGCLATGCSDDSECDRDTYQCKKKPASPQPASTPSEVKAPALPAANPPALPCTDSDENCEFWADSGECTANAAYMLEKCKASCRAPGCILPPDLARLAPAPAPAPALAPLDAAPEAGSAPALPS